MIGSVGLMLGQLVEASGTTGLAGVSSKHLHVQGVIPGSFAEKSGKFRPGDEIESVDGITFDGKTLQEAKRMFVGHEGSMVHFSIVRPATSQQFSVRLRLQALVVQDFKDDVPVHASPAAT